MTASEKYNKSVSCYCSLVVPPEKGSNLVKDIFFQNSKKFDYIYIENDIIIMDLPFIYKNLIIENCYIKVNESQYKHCGVTLHFFTGQIILKKNIEKI